MSIFGNDEDSWAAAQEENSGVYIINLENMLKDCLKVINKYPNTPLQGKYKNTYAIATAIEKLLK